MADNHVRVLEPKQVRGDLTWLRQQHMLASYCVMKSDTRVSGCNWRYR